VSKAVAGSNLGSRLAAQTRTEGFVAAGEMAERFNAAVLKDTAGHPTGTGEPP